MIWAFFAFGPITANFLIFFLSGKRPSFFKSTMPSAAAFLNSFRCDGWLIASSCRNSGLLKRLENSATVNILLTLSLISTSSTFPSLMELIKLAPQTFPGPGISRSRPPLAFSSVSSAAPQSLTTYPSNPHSSFSMSINNSWCELQ